METIRKAIFLIASVSLISGIFIFCLSSESVNNIQMITQLLMMVGGICLGINMGSRYD